MKEFKIVFEEKEKLNKDLQALHRKLDNISYSSILFRIYAELMDKERINEAITALIREFPDTPYTGCTTAANVKDAELASSDIMIVCMVFESPSTKFILGQYDVATMSREQLLGLANHVISKFSWAKAFEFLCSMPVMGLDHFVECMDVFAKKGIVFGGGAINRQIDVSENWVFSTGNNISNTSFVCVVYGGDELEFCTKTIVGWRPLGKEFKITKAERNVLYTIDDEPTFDAYSRYLKIENDKSFLMNSTEFPLLCKTKEGAIALRTAMVCNDDGSINFAAKIDNFVTARLTYGSQENIISDAYLLTAQMAEFGPQVLHAYSCFGRKSFLEENCIIDIKPFAALGDLSGFFTSGELTTNADGLFVHHNETLVIVGIKEGKTAPIIDYPRLEKEKIVPLNRRLVNFIGEATKELNDANTQLEALVSEVEEQKMEADLANRAKSEFLANMSHEIRTPINAILGFDTMILRESEDEGITKYAMDIHSAGENLLSIINDILDLSKVESGKMEIIPVKYDLSSLVNDTVNMIRMKAEEKGLEVIVDVDETIPAWLYGDDIRIRQVLVNILNNAIKYTENGSVTFRLSGERDGEDVILHASVEDTGTGIKEEDMSRLFEKFRRIEEGKNRNVEGTGLGMSITIMLLSLMGSKLNVKSRYGEGSTFSFDLRQKVMGKEPIGKLSDRITVSQSVEKYETSFSAPDAKILVVDDNKMNRKVIISLLKDICKNITEADGGYACLALTKKEKFDVIFLDHMMPDLDGIETYHRMKSSEEDLNKETPTIMLTANAITGAKDEYLSEGFEAFLAKPVEPDKLEEMIRKYVPKEKIIIGAPVPVSDETYTEPGNVIPEINGIDVNHAISKLGTKEALLETMHLFVKGSAMEREALSMMKKNIAENTNAELDSDLLHDYEVKVHSMKSSAAFVGALAVSGLARALEHAAAKKDKNTVLSVTDYFLDEWDSLSRNMKEALSENEEKKPFEKDLFIAGLKDIREVLDAMDIDTADSIINELGTYEIPESLKLSFESLEGAVVNVNQDKVGELVTSMISELNA